MRIVTCRRHNFLQKKGLQSKSLRFYCLHHAYDNIDQTSLKSCVGTGQGLCGMLHYGLHKCLQRKWLPLRTYTPGGTITPVGGHQTYCQPNRRHDGSDNWSTAACHQNNGRDRFFAGWPNRPWRSAPPCSHCLRPKSSSGSSVWRPA